MKRIYLIIILVIVMILPSVAAKSYEMEVLNLIQVNETEFTFDVRMRNTNPSEPFAIDVIQWQFSFNTALMNGGSLNNSYLNYVDGTTDLEGVIVPQSSNFTTDQVVLRWVTDFVGDGAQTTLFNNSDWKRIGTFRLQLRNTLNTAFQNFADVSHNLSFVPLQVIVNWCNYTGIGPYYRSGAFFEKITNQTLTNNLTTRLLAGYYFSGTGDWTTTARWNNITSANVNTLPGPGNNAIIGGSATLTDAQTVNQLVVATGGYLVLNQAARLTTGNLFNDNTSGGGSGSVTVAKWDFEDITKIDLPYTADDGIIENTDIATIDITGNTRLDDYYTAGDPGAIWTTGSRAPQVDRFYRTPVYGSWIVQFSTIGIVDLKLSSEQYIETGGPSTWKIQWSLNGTSWTDVTGGGLSLIGGTWTPITNLVLPENLNLQSTVFIRWLYHTGTSQALTAIDNIIITGANPPSGLLIQSTASGTGSLIHNNAGVNATVERYIEAVSNWLTAPGDGWHLLSSPVTSQAIGDTWTPTGTGNDYDFFAFDETIMQPYEYWLNQKVAANNITTFIPGKGYLVAYQQTDTKKFTGELNSASLTPGFLTYTSGSPFEGWNLVGNPFASPIGWTTGSWTKTNIDAIAQVWYEASGSYKTTDDELYINNVIPFANGFMVHASASNPVLTIPANARIPNSTNWYKSGNDDCIYLVANDTDGGTSQSSILRFNTDATNGYDAQFDSYFIAGFAPMFYSVSGNESYALNTLPEKTYNLSVPFRFVKNGSTAFNIELAQNLPETVVYLEDKKTSTIQNLVENPVYNFTAAEGDDANRFILHFGTLSVIDNPSVSDFSVWYNQGDIHFSSLPANMQSLSLIDMAGRELRRYEKPASDIISIGNSFAPAWYLVKITLTDKVIVKKIFIN